MFVGAKVAVAELWPFQAVRAANEPTPPPVDEFVSSCDGIFALIQDELQALQSQLIPKNPPLLMPSIMVLLSLVSCHSSWVVMGVCHQHDVSLLLLWLQCPTSCAICINWVVAEAPPSYGWLSVFVLAVSFMLASLTSVLYVSMPILILLYLLDRIFILVCATC